MLSRFVLLAALTIAAPAFAQGGYFTSIPDLPVAPGMSEDEDMFGGLFTGERGRLIVATAHGPTSPEDLHRFYAESLPALGWSYQVGPREDDMVFVRGRERLALHVERQTDGTYLRARIAVSPPPAGGD